MALQLPRTAAHESVVCGVPTRFVMSAYSNRIMVVVTQADNMGTLVHAECDNPLDAATGSYTTRVLLGRRDDEILEVYARTLVELMHKRGVVQQLLLAISIKAHSSEMFKAIMQEIDENRVW